MAGSWNHLVHHSYPGEPPELEGKPRRDPAGSFPLIENMGDAVEALEECYGMVQFLASELSRRTTPNGSDDNRAFWVADAARHYKEGFRRAGAEPPRW